MTISSLRAVTPSVAHPAPPRPTTETSRPPVELPDSGSRPSPPVAAAPQQLIASKLFIELDEASARYVQTHVDPNDNSVLRRFPSESQLAFSRGVSAYVRATRSA